MLDIMIVEKIWFESQHIFIKTNTGITFNSPLALFKRLANATQKQLNNYELSPYGIHWQELDEDLSFEGFINNSNNAIH
jgi:hypothetical protein